MNRLAMALGMAASLLVAASAMSRSISEPAAGPPDAAPLAEGDNGPVGMFDGHQDVGDVRHAGSVEFDQAHGVHIVTGSGANMWGERDAFHYAWKRASGDVTLSGIIGFLGRGTDPHRKACLLFRQDLEADSPYVDVAVHGDGLTSLQFRERKGGPTHEIQLQGDDPHHYLAIEKKGKYVRLYVRTRKGWDFTGAALRFDLADPFYAGIGVCSHNADVTEKGTFMGVTLGGPLPVSREGAVQFSTLETMSFPSMDRRVVYRSTTRFEAPNWLPDGKSLIFNSEGRIHRISATGGTPEPIDTGFATRCNNDHGLSPDGKMLAISDHSQGDHRSRIYTLPITGGEPALITPKAPSYWHGWSPDGRTLAYCAERNGEFDIYTIPAGGGDEVRLTSTKGLDDGPEYSPDGKWIYFNSDRTGTMQIWRMAPDGNGQEALTSDEFNNWFPHPSPDGKWLVFLSYEKDVTGHPPDRDVCLRRMSLANRKIDVIARFRGGQGTINVPCWSPDGKRIAFVTYQSIP